MTKKLDTDREEVSVSVDVALGGVLEVAGWVGLVAGELGVFVGSVLKVMPVDVSVVGARVDIT